MYVTESVVNHNNKPGIAIDAPILKRTWRTIACDVPRPDTPPIPRLFRAPRPTRMATQNTTELAR